MKTKQSNVQVTSNVYPVNVRDNRIDMEANPRFVSRITNRTALRRLVDIVHPGLNYDDLRIRYAKTIPGISDWQVKRVGIPDACSLAPAGEKPWGVSIVYGELKYVCKCKFRECPRISECKPEEVSDTDDH